MERIGIRELRQHASQWLRRVEAGETFEVTDRGRPIATLAPVGGSESDLDRLIRSGDVRPPLVRRSLSRPKAMSSNRSASEALADLRDEDRT